MNQEYVGSPTRATPEGVTATDSTEETFGRGLETGRLDG
jgi:hypothetical protein